jgi:hypothetical protein
MTALNGRHCNIDGDFFLYTPRDGREGNTGEAVDRYVDRLAEARVKVLSDSLSVRGPM